MTDAWAQAEALSNKLLESGGMYIRLANDGDKVVGVFVGDPYARQVHWTGSAYEECAGKRCEHCEAGVRAGLRVACNFYVLADKAMKIIEGGPRWFGDLLKVRKKYGLDAWACEIERHGAANSPKTTYTILPDTKLDAALQAQVAAAKRHDLERDAATAARDAYTDGRAPAEPPASVGAAVTAAVARELHEQLRQLPKRDVSVFFETFGIERVSQLRLADEVQARDFLAQRQELPF